MPIIVNRLSHQGGEPCLPITDTGTHYTNELSLVPGLPPPSIGVWLDSRFCTCGNALNSREVDENAESQMTVKTMCPECETRDFFNVCSVAGVIRPPAQPSSVECVKCYKYLSECSSGYCIYVAIMTDHAQEVKVGTTKLSRVDARVREGGYAAMTVLLPRTRSSISLPEADYLEKRVIDGLSLAQSGMQLRVSQYFFKKVGYVGKPETKANTMKALGLLPSESVKLECEGLAEQVIQGVRGRAGSPSELVDLEIDRTCLNENDYVDFGALSKVDLSLLRPLERHIIKGRPYRELPASANVIGVKGFCVLISDSANGAYHSVLFDRRSYQGREAFDPAGVLPGRQNATLLQWFGGQ